MSSRYEKTIVKSKSTKNINSDTNYQNQDFA